MTTGYKLTHAAWLKRGLDCQLNDCFEWLWGKSYPDSMLLELDQKRHEYVAIKSALLRVHSVYDDALQERIEDFSLDCTLLNIERLRLIQHERSNIQYPSWGAA